MPFQYIVCKFRIYAIYCYDILILTLYFELCNFLDLILASNPLSEYNDILLVGVDGLASKIEAKNLK